MTVLIYVDTSKQVGDPDHLKVFANQDAAETWLEENDPEGVAFEYQVLFDELPKVCRVLFDDLPGFLQPRPPRWRLVLIRWNFLWRVHDQTMDGERGTSF